MVWDAVDLRGSRLFIEQQVTRKAGSLMHQAGVPLKRAQEILGHASERTTPASKARSSSA